MLAGYFISNHPFPPKLLLPPPSKVKWYTPYESKFITKQIKDRQAPVFVLQSLHQFSLLPVGVNAWLTRWLAHLISSLRFLTLIGKNITMISYQVLPTNELRNDEWRFFGQSQRTLTIQWTNQNSNYIYLTPSTGKHMQARHDWFSVVLLMVWKSGASFSSQSRNIVNVKPITLYWERFISFTLCVSTCMKEPALRLLNWLRNYRQSAVLIFYSNLITLKINKITLEMKVWSVTKRPNINTAGI